MKQAYIDRIYSGWLAKIIGIRFGAPIEGWSYEKIANLFGELTGYPADYKNFAADDDSNGPLFFLRALEDSMRGERLTAQDVGEALMNYAPFEHGFFWWGGYGISTEHTAYLNLRNGMKAPQSGSIAQNGSTTAEQIGGQIFIDTWGLVNPGNPDRAAKMAAQAASVTHDGNGVYGGVFVAACIAYAFEESDIQKIIEKGLSYIPADCEYTRAVRAVVAYHAANPDNWRDCFSYIHDDFGYDKYPGACHIIPNIAVMILGLLYGEGDFSRTLSITNMCGWDTDCNVGNVATIMGVLVGCEGIGYEQWRKPINDLLVCSSVIGSLNIMDIPFGASYIAKLAYELDGEAPPEPYADLFKRRIDSCHFEYPGSTHCIRLRRALMQNPGNQELTAHIENSSEAACTGTRSLKFVAMPLPSAEKLLVYKKTYYQPSDFSDSRYDPCFSPLVYPGMTVHGSAMIPDYGYGDGHFSAVKVRLYVHDLRSDRLIESEPVELAKGEWTTLSFTIPPMEGALLDEMGFSFDLLEEFYCFRMELAGFIDDLYADGDAHYTIDFAKEQEEHWGGNHREISQFTKLKGLMYLQDEKLHLSCADFAEAYTGRHDWTDCSASFEITPITGERHYVNIRVQGALRSYAAGLLPDNTFAILKNRNGYEVLAKTTFDWQPGQDYTINVSAKGNRIEASVNKTAFLSVVDEDRPYLCGSLGVSMENNTHTAYRKITVH